MTKMLRRLKKIEEKMAAEDVPDENKTVSKLLSEFKSKMSACEAHMKRMVELIERQEDLLQRVKHTNEIVDETASNVLLAIRQNEYLQAWHPNSAEALKFKRNK